MATDATGTPTTFAAIPTYNTAVDKPSGLGHNAAMQTIDAQLQALNNLVGVTVGANPGLGQSMTWSPGIILLEEFPSTYQVSNTYSRQTLQPGHIQNTLSAFTLVSSPVRAGARSLKCLAGGVTAGTSRAEVAHDAIVSLSQGILGDRHGDDVWYGFSINVPNSLPTISTGAGSGVNALVFEWMNQNPWVTNGLGFTLGLNTGAYDWGNPSFGMTWGMSSGFYDVGTLAYLSPGIDVGQQGLDVAPSYNSGGFPPNVWVDYKIHIKCSIYNDGLFEVWTKLSTSSTWEKVLTKLAVPTMEFKPGSLSPQPAWPTYGIKCGLYQAGYNATGFLYLDRVVEAISESVFDDYWTNGNVTYAWRAMRHRPHFINQG